MRLTKEQTFLYTRIAILVASVGWIASAVAGLKGFPFWYGGFVLCFWIAFGLVNYQQQTSLWLLARRRVSFFLFYAALAGSLLILDQFGLRSNLWFYPFYRGWWFFWVYFVLYPFASLAVLELIYAVSRVFGERLEFVSHRGTRTHHAVDVTESVLFLLLWGFFILGVAGGITDMLGLLPFLALGWLVLATVKLAFHIRHWGHYALILILAGVLAAVSHELPNTVAREWIYLSAPILNTLLLGIPLWAIVGWYWFTLFVLRLWIFLVLRPRVR